MYEFDWSSIPGALPFLWDGMKISLVITLQAVVIGIVWGTILAMMRLSSIKTLSWFAAGYVNMFRAIPLVMVLLWFFLIVPRFVETLLDFPPGSDLRLSSAMMGFALFEAAYYSEIIRAGIQSVPKGQIAAASALGMNYAQAMCLVVLPQAFRMTIPPLINVYIALTKNTSVAGGFFVVELFASTRQLVNDNGNIVIPILVLAAALYLAITVPLGLAAVQLEKRWVVSR